MQPRPAQAGPLHAELRAALARCRQAFAGVAAFSALINLLALTGAMYMLQVYDRVIPAHSTATLIGLTLLMLILYAGYGMLDVVRMRILSRIGLRIDRTLRERIFGLVLTIPLRSVPRGDGQQPIRDLDQIRAFLSGNGPIALFDLPWMPFYLFLVFLLHPALGLLGLAGALVLIALTALTEFKGRDAAQAATANAAARQVLSEAGRRNAEAVRALGMTGALSRQWSALNEKLLAGQLDSGDEASSYTAFSKVVRLVLQSAVLGLGAYLVILGQASAGVMIAASILVSRALAPVEIAIANWRGFLNARQGATRLSALLEALPERAESMALPRPTRSFQVEGLWVAAPGEQRAILHNISFALEKGVGLGIIGPSAAGKSTLARALVGAWAPLRGAIRLDGAALEHWASDQLGAFIGYLPQDIELFDGSVAQNIARFDPGATPQAIIAAAQAAGVHDMIVRLAEGYDTKVGPGGAALSAGQRQRVALARALYGDPFLVVLDEPNSNLDAEGDAALTSAILAVRARGGIAVVIAHRPSALAGVDQVMVMNAGQLQAIGPKEEILRAHLQPASSSVAGQQRLKIAAQEASGS